MKDIEFTTNDPLIEEHFSPKPSINCLPQWYSALPNLDLYKSEGNVNVKNCLPVFDLITSGYIVFNAYQVQLEERFSNFQNMLYISTMKQPQPNDIKTFSHNQCPSTSTPKDIFKVKLDWKIKTPPGYSCLIQQPPYLQNDRYRLFPCILDTDTFDDFISIAGTVIGKNVVYLNPGDPLVQVIPFKRDDWKMSTKVSNINSKTSHFLFHGYKRLFHKLKKFV